MRMITDPQKAFIERLATEHVLDAEMQVLFDARIDMTAQNASRFIDRLRAAPRVAARAAVTPGYYMTATGEAFHVVTNKAGTGTYAKRLVTHEGERPSWDYAPGAVAALGALTPMTGADAARLGLSSGHCIKCLAPLGGTTLSARVAALVGYGEVCAQNQGWPFPKGAAAQRAALSVAA